MGKNAGRARRVALTTAAAIVLGGAGLGGWHATRQYLRWSYLKDAAGEAWEGGLAGGLDFRMKGPSFAEGELDYRFASWQRGSNARGPSGTLSVSVSGRKIKMVLRTADGTPVRSFDGVIWHDGNSIAGLSYALPGGHPSEGGSPWWATIEHSKTPSRRRPALNSATVAEMETLLGKSSPAAWRVVERRFFFGPYRAPTDLDAVAGLDAASIAKLKEGADAR